MKIGTLIQDHHGFVTGEIRVLGVGVVPIALAREISRKDGKPYFKIIADPDGIPYEIGAAFSKQKDGMIYHSVSIDSPVFPAPVNGALFEDMDHEGRFNLVWDRPEKSKLGAHADVNGEAPEHGHRRRFVGANSVATP
jgi:uncharacterized protein (DUF736 family)